MFVEDEFAIQQVDALATYIRISDEFANIPIFVIVPN